MAITILPPSDSDDDHPSSHPSPPSPASDNEPDFDMDLGPSAKRPKLTHRHSILVPGDLITTDPQWMRGHGTYNAPSPASTSMISATLSGPLSLTNKLVSVQPAAASRYRPSIGDLVIGRITAVEKSRWRVDICAPLLASLPLSAINLPGGVLRRRTTADELQMRMYFQEGDVVVAEVQGVGGVDGVAGLHTRSLKYGKLRNGVLVRVRAGNGGLGVVRGKRQVFRVEGRNGAERLEVKLGVNGCVWISQFVDAEEEGGMKGERQRKGKLGMSISNLDDLVSNEIYSSQNDEMNARTRHEIARVCGCISLLAEQAVKVDEDTLLKAYHASAEAEMELMLDEAEQGLAAEMRTLVDKSIMEAVMA